jgi:ATP-dependent protease ClpP protease subunit
MIRIVPLFLLLGCSTLSAAPCVNCCPVHRAAPAKPAGSIEVGDFDEKTLEPVQSRFDELVKRGDKVLLFRVNSNGGEINAGMDLIQHIRDAKREHGLRVECVVDVKAYSMGFYFLQAACDDRWMSRGSLLMAHGGATGAQGKIDQLKSTISALEAMNDMLFGWAADRMKMPKAAFKTHVDHSDWWMSPDQAVAMGAADKIVDPLTLPAPLKLDEPASPLADLLKLLGN